MSITATQPTSTITPAGPPVKEIYEEDVHKIIRILFRDGRTVDRTAEELADDVRQQRIYKESGGKVRKSLESQFAALWKKLNDWQQANADHLFCCVLVHPEIQRHHCSDVYFFAVQNSNQYSDCLSRNLTRLEIDVEDSEQFNLVNMKVMELPAMDREQIRAFVNNYVSTS